MDLAKHALDLAAMCVEVLQPIQRGALIIHAAPAPFLFDPEQIGILPDQMTARHHAGGKETLRDPVLAIGAIEQIGTGAVGEDMQKETAMSRPKAI
jgi:hypothetical protein